MKEKSWMMCAQSENKQKTLLKYVQEWYLLKKVLRGPLRQDNDEFYLTNCLEKDEYYPPYQSVDVYRRQINGSIDIY